MRIESDNPGIDSKRAYSRKKVLQTELDKRTQSPYISHRSEVAAAQTGRTRFVSMSRRAKIPAVVAVALLTCISAIALGPSRPSDTYQTESWAEPGWGTPEIIQGRGTGFWDTQVASNSAGIAFAVWSEYDGVRWSVWSNRYLPGLGWGNPGLVEINDASSAYGAQVAVDDAGNALVVWEQSGDAVYSRRYVAGVGWSEPERIEVSGYYSGSRPQISMDNAGNALAVWERRGDVWSNRYAVGSGWGNAELIEADNSAHCYLPNLAMDDLGNAVAVWTQNLDDVDSIWSNRYDAVFGWGNAVLVESNDSSDAWYADVALDDDGNAIAVWNQGDASTHCFIWSSRYVPGSGWDTAVPIETADVRWDECEPQVAMDSFGNAIAVWFQLDNGFHSIASNRYVVGSGWGAPSLLETSDGEAWVEDLEVDGAGNAVVVWDQEVGVVSSIWSNRYDIGTGWGTPELVELDDSGDASSAESAMDSAGNTIAVWTQWDGARQNVWSNRYLVGAGWGSAELIGIEGLPSASRPEVAVDHAGNAVVVWDQADSYGSTDIWSCRYNASYGWQSAVPIETNESGNAVSPEVGMDYAGNAIVVWRQSDGTRNNIWSNRYRVAGGWSGAQLIETTATNATTPQVAVNDAGNAFAIWVEDTGSRRHIWSNRYVVGVGWESAQLIETADSMVAGYPEIAVDSAGNAIAVWGEASGLILNVWSNRYVVGSGWQTAQLIETDNSGDAGPIEVATDGSGNAVAVWRQSDGTRYNIWSNRYSASTGFWGVAQLIETDNTGIAEAPSVAMTREGDAVVVWAQSDGVRYYVLSNRFDAGTGLWGTAQIIESSNLGPAAYPVVGVDSVGNAIAVWSQYNGVASDIWSNRYVLGEGWGIAQLIEERPDSAVSPRLAVSSRGNAVAVWTQNGFGGDANIWSNRFISAHVPILPIYIDDALSSGNNWAWARTQPWCRGSGTLADPYVISWISISNASTCIEIRNSNKNFRVENCTLRNSETAISLVNVQNGVIIHNAISQNSGHNIILDQSTYNEVRENEINETTGEGNGVYLWRSNHNRIDNNTISFTHFGIYPEQSDSNRIENNTIRNNGWGISASNCNNCVIMLNELDRNDNQGLVLEMSHNNIVVGNHVTNNSWIGIWVFSSNSNELRENIVQNNTNHGIMLIDTGFCNLIGGESRNNTGDGIFLLESSKATVSGCSLKGNNRGLEIDSSSQSVLYGNNISYNANEGMLLRNASLNTVSDNEIWGNGHYGVNMSAGSSSNSVFNNTFGLNNGAISNLYNPEHVQAFDDTVAGNYWNTSGSPHGFGNRWWDWQWPDSDFDGIVDMPYEIDGGADAKDYCPLTTTGGIEPIPEFGVMFPLVLASLAAFVLTMRSWRRKEL